MTFKKLSFLYLVFILFLFFSSPGNYVVHYDQMQVTQEELNGRLNAKLISFDAKNEDDKLLKETTLQCLQELDELNLKYKKYANDFSIYGDRGWLEVRGKEVSFGGKLIEYKLVNLSTRANMKGDLLRAFIGDIVEGGRGTNLYPTRKEMLDVIRLCLSNKTP